MRYQELEAHLFAIRDEAFAEFSKSLSNSEYISIGVKIPVLQKLIKEHAKDEDLNLEEFDLGKYLEVDYLYFGLSCAKLKTIDEQLDFVIREIHLAKSWCITDSIPTFLKKHTVEKYLEVFLKLYDSPHVYDRRMAYVLGLRHRKDAKVLTVLDYMKPDEAYMVMMAEAWLLSFVAIEFPNEIYDFLKKSEDVSMKRKAISKISDSFRFDEATKQRFKDLRKG